MESNFFNQDMLPCDFKVTFEQIGQKEFFRMVTHFSSFPVEKQIGRRFYFVVKNHDIIIGFIRINSPVICLSNRNTWFKTKLIPDQINQHMMNGSVIVPVQPFGFNYLGGKLLTLVCICNEMTEIIRQKTPDYCFFETTSLYGSIKHVSQYDGLEPFVKFLGLTQSNNILMYPSNEIFNELKKYIEPVYGLPEYNGRVTDTTKSSPKQREFNKLLSILGQNLKALDVEKYKAFRNLKKEHMTSMTQKGYYYSCLGYKNVKDHVVNGTTLIENDRSRFDFENLFSWWLRKATNRYEKLKSNGTFRTNLEDYGLGTEGEMIR